jgi:hypothetical protein
MLGGEAAAKAGFTVEEVVSSANTLENNLFLTFFCVGWRELSSLEFRTERRENGISLCLKYNNAGSIFNVK